MEFNEQWIPVVAEGVKWVKDKLGSSKKELKLKVADLEAQVKVLTIGNEALLNSIEQIVSVILNQLDNGKYIVDSNTIVLINDNHGKLNVGINSKQCESIEIITSEFDKIDREIAQSRLLYLSERGDKNDNS